MGGEVHFNFFWGGGGGGGGDRKMVKDVKVVAEEECAPLIIKVILQLLSFAFCHDNSLVKSKDHNIYTTDEHF